MILYTLKMDSTWENQSWDFSRLKGRSYPPVHRITLPTDRSQRQPPAPPCHSLRRISIKGIFRLANFWPRNKLYQRNNLSCLSFNPLLIVIFFSLKFFFQPNRIDLSTGPRSERNLQCPVCPQDVSFSDAETLQIHIDTHFSSKGN